MTKSGTGKVGRHGAAESEEPELKDEVTEALGRKLRAHYQGLVEQPLPDKFTKLLAELGKENAEKDRE